MRYLISKTTEYELKVTLRGIRLPVWRRFIVQSDLLLADLAKIILTVMGWTDDVPHFFEKNGTKYFRKTTDDLYWDTINEVDFLQVRIHNLLEQRTDSIHFYYGNNSDWICEVELKFIRPLKNPGHKPRVISGNMANPSMFASSYQQYKDFIKPFATEETVADSQLKEAVFSFDKKTCNALLCLRNFGQIRF